MTTQQDHGAHEGRRARVVTGLKTPTYSLRVVVYISTFYSSVALVFSLSAIIVSVISARRQSSDVRRSNFMIFMSERAAYIRSPEYLEAANYVRAELPEIDPATGVYGLPVPARDYVLLIGGFYQDLGTLALTKVLEQDLIAALFYANIREMWGVLEPYIHRERELWKDKNAGDFWPNFEHLAAYAHTISHEKIYAKWGRRYRFVSTPQEATPPGEQRAAVRVTHDRGPS